MKQQLIFKIQGSEDLPYTVTFTRTDNNVTATCTCRAGTFGQQCKHRVNLLVGDVTAVVTGAAHAGDMAGLIAGTDVETTTREFITADEVFNQAKMNRSIAAKRLAASFRD